MIDRTLKTSVHLPENLAVEIRPGVFRPDWSAVAKPRAREALNGRLAARVGLLDRWAIKLEAVEDLVWRTILRLYADLGKPPKLAEIAAAARISVNDVAGLLRALESRDLIDLDPHSRDIQLAYPFTQATTDTTFNSKGTFCTPSVR